MTRLPVREELITTNELKVIVVRGSGDTCELFSHLHVFCNSSRTFIHRKHFYFFHSLVISYIFHTSAEMLNRAVLFTKKIDGYKFGNNVGRAVLRVTFGTRGENPNRFTSSFATCRRILLYLVHRCIP